VGDVVVVTQTDERSGDGWWCGYREADPAQGQGWFPSYSVETLRDQVHVGFGHIVANVGMYHTAHPLATSHQICQRIR
jgi:hypothetical protein